VSRSTNFRFPRYKISPRLTNRLYYNPFLSVVVLGGFGCCVSCPNAVGSRVIHLVFHRLQHNCFSSLDSINLVYQHPYERLSATTDTFDLLFIPGEIQLFLRVVRT
jgi:hypothetical protein